jgi:hypothetical protein
MKSANVHLIFFLATRGASRCIRLQRSLWAQPECLPGLDTMMLVPSDAMPFSRKSQNAPELKSG